MRKRSSQAEVDLRGSVWQPAPAKISLEPGCVHLWLARLDLSARGYVAHRHLLDDEERARADRLKVSEKRRQFAAARAVLRCILARYVPVAPRALIFTRSAAGRPSLRYNDAHQPLDFNLAHSGGWMALALAAGMWVGVDIEVARPVDLAAIVGGGYFSPAETTALLSLEEPARGAAFFTTWTRKEAYIKARGGGFAIPFDQFTVSVLPGEPPALLEDQSDSGAPRRWRLDDLPLPAGLTGSVAVSSAEANSPSYWLYEK